MARTAQPATKGVRKSPAAPAKKKSALAAAKTSAKVKKAPVRAAPAAAKKTGTMKKPASKKPAVKPAKAVAKRPVKGPVKKAGGKAAGTPKKKTKSVSVERYRCRLCGYIYSPLRGEPQNGIAAGTEFEDLPESYVCPVCGQRGKGRIGKWGFEPWRPTRYVCSVCGYVYDEKRGEPHRGIKPGTKFDDLPDTYTCPVCAIDPKISVRFGKVFKQGFEPLQAG